MVLYMIPPSVSNRLPAALHSLTAVLSPFVRMRPKELQTIASSDTCRCFEFLDFLTIILCGFERLHASETC